MTHAVLAAGATCAFVSDPKYSTGQAACAASCNDFYQSYTCQNGTKACLVDDAVISNADCPSGQTCCMVGEYATASPTTAQPTTGGNAPQQPTATSFDTSGCKVPGTSYSFPCPLGQRPIAEIIGSLIKWTLGLVGALFFVMFVYGGFLYIVAGDSAKNAEAGQKTLVNAVIGLAIVIGSYMVVGWIIDLFSSSVGK